MQIYAVQICKGGRRFFLEHFGCLFPGTSPVKSRSNPPVSTNYKSVENRAKHPKASKPAWLLALEIVTGTMAAVVFLTVVFTTLKRCNSRSSMIIPWKKSASDKDRLAVYIGKLVVSTNPFLFHSK